MDHIFLDTLVVFSSCFLCNGIDILKFPINFFLNSIGGKSADCFKVIDNSE